MPWKPEDADKHKKGLSNKQRKRWARTANAVLADCEARGGSDCEKKAIMTASSQVGRKTAGGEIMEDPRVSKITETKITEFQQDEKIDNTAKVEKTFVEIPFDFIEKNVEKRHITGIVLEPEKVDLQGDIYSAEVIEKACDNFNTDVRRMGMMHKQFNRDLIPLRSYIVEDDRGHAMINKNKVVNGTWILTAKATNDETWEKIKKGEITGWSIGAFVYYIPLDEEAA